MVKNNNDEKISELLTLFVILYVLSLSYMRKKKTNNHMGDINHYS